MCYTIYRWKPEAVAAKFRPIGTGSVKLIQTSRFSLVNLISLGSANSGAKLKAVARLSRVPATSEPSDRACLCFVGYPPSNEIRRRPLYIALVRKNTDPRIFPTADVPCEANKRSCVASVPFAEFNVKSMVD